MNQFFNYLLKGTSVDEDTKIVHTCSLVRNIGTQPCVNPPSGLRGTDNFRCKLQLPSNLDEVLNATLTVLSKPMTELVGRIWTIHDRYS
jgi:hypothetical protein